MALQDILIRSFDFQDEPFKSADDCALELFHQNKLELAIAVCNDGLDLNPKDECLWLIKGMCFSKQEKYDDLLKCAVPLLEIDRKNPTYWYLTARVLHRLSKFEDELEHWWKLIEIDPHHTGAWKGIGDCLFALGRYQEAVEAFDAELKLGPSDTYCQSRRDAVIALSELDGGSLAATVAARSTSLVVSLLGWWTEQSEKEQMGPYPETRHFNLVCKIDNLSNKELLLGKEISMYRHSQEIGEMHQFACALILEDNNITLPLRLPPNSEVDPVDIDVDWTCPADLSDADYVRELFDNTQKILGVDEEFGTIMRFVGE